MSENGNDTTIAHADPTQVAAGVAAQAGELAPTSGMARAMAEVQSAVILARQFPRDTSAAWQELVRSCRRPAFAKDARYSFRRSGTLITGPTVKMAREAARIWGNFRSGFYVANDDEATGTRTVIGWAWDLQTNYYREESVRFKRLVQRRRDDGAGNQVTVWVEPDERDARELTGRQGAVAERNAILRVLPSDYVADAEAEAVSTLSDAMAADPDAELKKILAGFDKLNVTAAMLESYLGHPLKICSPTELVELRDVYRGIRDGETTPAEVFGNGDVLGAQAAETLDSLGADAGDGEGAGAGAPPPSDVPASPPPAGDDDDLGDPSQLRVEELRDLDRGQLLSIIDERAKSIRPVLVDAVAKVRRYLSAQYKVRNIGGIDDDGLRWIITNWANLVEVWQAEAEAAEGAEGETNGEPDPNVASQDAEADAANGTLPGVGS